MDSYTMQTLSASTLPVSEEMTTASSVFASEGELSYDGRAKRRFPVKRLIAGILLALLAAALAVGVAKLISSRKAKMAMESLPVPVLPPPGDKMIKIWTPTNQYVKYPTNWENPFVDTEPGHRDWHPYFVKRTPEDYRQHLIVTGNAATNTLGYLNDKWQGKFTQRLANCVNLHTENSEPLHKVALLITDIQLHINVLEGLRLGKITETDLGKLEFEELLEIIEKKLPSALSDGLSKMNKKGTKQEKLNYKRLKAFKGMGKSQTKRLVQLLVQRYQTFLTPEMKQKYTRQLKKKRHGGFSNFDVKKMTRLKAENHAVAPYAELLYRLRKDI